jgi:hypothetical protein
LAVACAVIASGIVTARSDTLEWALIQAYRAAPLRHTHGGSKIPGVNTPVHARTSIHY